MEFNWGFKGLKVIFPLLLMLFVSHGFLLTTEITVLKIFPLEVFLKLIRV